MSGDLPNVLLKMLPLPFQLYISVKHLVPTLPLLKARLNSPSDPRGQGTGIGDLGCRDKFGEKLFLEAEGGTSTTGRGVPGEVCVCIQNSRLGMARIGQEENKCLEPAREQGWAERGWWRNTEGTESRVRGP